MKKSVPILLCCLVLFNFNINAHEKTNSDNEKKIKHEIGFSFPFYNKTYFDNVYRRNIIYSNGMTYRFYLNDFGFQASYSPYIEGATKSHKAGLTFLYIIAKREHVNFFLYQGNYYGYYEYERISWPFPYYPYYPNDPYIFCEYNNLCDHLNISQTYNISIGMGIEFVFLKRMGLNIMGGYGTYDNFDKFSLTGEAGIFFKF